MADSQKPAATPMSSSSPSPSFIIDAFVGTAAAAAVDSDTPPRQIQPQNNAKATAAATASGSSIQALIDSFSGVESKSAPPSQPPQTTTSDNKPKEGTSMVEGLIQALSGALVYTDVGNLETNRRLWNRYSEEWHEGNDKGSSTSTTSSSSSSSSSNGGTIQGNNKISNGTTPTQTPSGWVQEMAAHTATTSKKGPHDIQHPPTIVGEEWSSQEDLEEVLREFHFPYLTPESVVAEVGVGGGRVAVRVMGKCASLTCLDISAGMLSKAKAALFAHPAANTITKIDFVLLGDNSSNNNRIEYPKHLHSTCDFLYCFDVLVHVDLHTLYQTLHQIRLLLKPGGTAFFSTANLLTPAGFRRFAAQTKYTVGGFYFLSPDIVTLLLGKAGLKVLKTSEVPEGFKEFSDDKGPARGNLYYGRDFLVVVERMERAGEGGEEGEGKEG